MDSKFDLPKVQSLYALKLFLGIPSHLFQEEQILVFKFETTDGINFNLTLVDRIIQNSEKKENAACSIRVKSQNPRPIKLLFLLMNYFTIQKIVNAAK